MMDLFAAAKTAADAYEKNKEAFENLPQRLEQWGKFMEMIEARTRDILRNQQTIIFQLTAIRAVVDQTPELPQEIVENAMRNAAHDPRNQREWAGPDC